MGKSDSEGSGGVGSGPRADDGHENDGGCSSSSGGGGVEEVTKECLKRLAAATRASNGVLSSDRRSDWDYYSSFGGFRRVMEAQGDQVERMIRSLMKHSGVLQGTTAATTTSFFQSPEDLLEVLSEANDQLLERISLTLEEAAAKGSKTSGDAGASGGGGSQLLLEVTKRGLARISGSWNGRRSSAGSVVPAGQGQETGAAAAGGSLLKLVAARNVQRPQHAFNFRASIDNSAKNCFVPRLTEKPNALKPLALLPDHEVAGGYNHPYRFELEHFRIPDSQLMDDVAEGKAAKYLEGVTTIRSDVILVEDLSGLERMIEALKGCKEIAIDLEHHSYRTYLGLTCLMQISDDRGQDYVVDPFGVWTDMTLLNSVLTDPAIVKVLHGSYHDVMWMQRDFSLYMVNTFDTYLAAKALGFGRGELSLAYLLQHYLGVSVDKRFQLADWRMRPLPEQMLEYARSDTAHLLRLYNLMKRQLIDKGNEHQNLLRAVYEQSNELCLRRYEKPAFFEDSSFEEALNATKANLSNRQRAAFKDIFNWRDKVARQEDEGVNYVLPNHMLLKISSELPREMQGILACCNPVPPLVRQNLPVLHQFVLRARELPLSAVVPTSSASTGGADILAAVTTTTPSGSLKGFNEIITDPLHCPLDMSQFDQEVEAEAGHGLVLESILIRSRDDLDRMLELQEEHPDTAPADEPAPDAPDAPEPPAKGTKVAMKARPSISVFGIGKVRKAKKAASANKLGKALKRAFLSPFQRFLLLRPYLESLNRQDGGGAPQSLGTGNNWDDGSRSLDDDQQRIASIKAHFDALTTRTQENSSPAGPPPQRDLQVKKKAPSTAEVPSIETGAFENTDLASLEPDLGKVRRENPRGVNLSKNEKSRPHQSMLPDAASDLAENSSSGNVTSSGRRPGDDDLPSSREVRQGHRGGTKKRGLFHNATGKKRPSDQSGLPADDSNNVTSSKKGRFDADLGQFSGGIATRSENFKNGPWPGKGSRKGNHHQRGGGFNRGGSGRGCQGSFQRSRGPHHGGGRSSRGSGSAR